MNVGTLKEFVAQMKTFPGPKYSMLQVETKWLFLYTCPMGAKIREKMIYSSAKAILINQLTRLGSTIDVKVPTQSFVLC